MNSISLIQQFHQAAGQVIPGVAARSARYLLTHPRRYPGKAWEEEACAAAVPVSFRYGLTGLRWGDSGPVVLMLHGWEGRATQFARFIPALLASGRQVIALDGPAHGRSPLKAANVVMFAHALLEAAQELPGLEAVVAHSMGAGATAYALSLGLRAERVVLLAGPASFAGVLSRFAAVVGLPEKARGHFRQEVSRHVGVPVDALDIAALSAHFATPALLVHDRDDTVVPFSDAASLAQVWPQARLHETHGLGHWRVMTDPDVVSQVTGWLIRPTLN